jgi:hypothetical protein
LSSRIDLRVGSSHGVALLCGQHIKVLIASSCLWFLVPVQIPFLTSF